MVSASPTQQQSAGSPVDPTSTDRSSTAVVPVRRWPRPTPINIALIGIWVFGVLFATIVPWTLVSPTDTDPEPASVGLAFGASALGIMIFALAGIGMYRRTRNGSLLAFALIPGVSIGTGAIIFTATLLSL